MFTAVIISKYSMRDAVSDVINYCRWYAVVVSIGTGSQKWPGTRWPTRPRAVMWSKFPLV